MTASSTLDAIHRQGLRPSETRKVEADRKPCSNRDDDAWEDPCPAPFVRRNAKAEINKAVIRQKLKKQRHLMLFKAIDPGYLDSLFPSLLDLFRPQTVVYNGGIAKIPEWKISCYLEVMPGGIPTTDPNLDLLRLFLPLLDACDDLFLHWHRQQHACNNQTRQQHGNKSDSSTSDSTGRRLDGGDGSSYLTTSTTPSSSCRRLMTFITRYTPNPGEQALLKVKK
jgi:hypothetical protein